MCSAKPIIEEQNDYFIVGDSAYGISEVLTKPFSERELNNEVDQARRRQKILFNRRLCGARTVMSENIYATLKRRWPVLKNMRHHMKLAQKAIKVVCILENICREWNDDLPEDEEDITVDNMTQWPSTISLGYPWRMWRMKKWNQGVRRERMIWTILWKQGWRRGRRMSRILWNQGVS